MIFSKLTLRYIFYSLLWLAFLLLQVTLFAPLDKNNGIDDTAASGSNNLFESPIRRPADSPPEPRLLPPRDLQTWKKKKRRVGDAIFNNIDVYLRKHDPNVDFWSDVHCIGRDLRDSAINANFSWMFRSCHFRKLCFDTDTSEFILLKPSSSQSPFSRQELALGAINPRWSGRGFDKGFHKVKWFPREVNAETVPLYYELPSDVVMVPFHSMAAHNVGHLLWDDFYPIFTLLKLFGFIPYHKDILTSKSVDNPFQYLLLRWSTKDKLYATCERQKKKSKICQDNLERFLPLLGIDPATFSTVKAAVLKTNPNSLVQRPPQSHYVCSKEAVAGLGMLMDHGMKDHGWVLRDPNSGQDLIPHNLGRGGIFHDFRDFMVHNMGFPVEEMASNSNKRPKKIIFSAYSSKGYERSLGFQNQTMVLQKALSDNNNIQIRNIVMKELSLKEQIQVALEAAVFITVSGGGAVTATFLPPGSTLIVYYLEDGGFDFWRYNYTYTPARLDWDLLGNAGYLKVHWLPIKSMESADDLKVLEQLVMHDLNTMGLL